jgi:hypothetical protein
VEDMAVIGAVTGVDSAAIGEEVVWAVVRASSAEEDALVDLVVIAEVTAEVIGVASAAVSGEVEASVVIAEVIEVALAARGEVAGSEIGEEEGVVVVTDEVEADMERRGSRDWSSEQFVLTSPSRFAFHVPYVSYLGLAGVDFDLTKEGVLWALALGGV